MPLSINHATRVIFIPQDYLTHLIGTEYQLNVNDFRLNLKDWEDDEGIAMPDTHRHNTEVSLGGLILARVVEIINGYTITFEETGSSYSVELYGSNNNIIDVVNLGTISVRSLNSAGMIVVGGADPSVIADAVFDKVVEGTLDFKEMMRLMTSVLLGKVSGADTTTITFRDTTDTTDRVISTVDSVGNRTAVILDPSP